MYVSRIMCPLLTPKRVIYRFQEHMYEVYLRMDGAVVRHAGLSVIRVFLTIRGEEEKRFVHLYVCLLYKSRGQFLKGRSSHRKPQRNPGSSFLGRS